MPTRGNSLHWIQNSRHGDQKAFAQKELQLGSFLTIPFYPKHSSRAVKARGGGSRLNSLPSGPWVVAGWWRHGRRWQSCMCSMGCMCSMELPRKMRQCRKRLLKAEEETRGPNVEIKICKRTKNVYGEQRMYMVSDRLVVISFI
ncbi:hypothetical protein POM88_023533 [Heracleum sosnowskyi]|uniref:Uncharacterized protein n=1 Tax=Heracleum sosnowskyi TaxID=360622 RepID=A0AAD8IJR0_9APIA|nr:hypothetical protein POM88_023533 [Heracleum sosnowskyi]